MMSSETEDAVCNLQRQISKTAALAAQDCVERAVDELLRHPESTLPEGYQRRNAMRHARWGMTRQNKKTSFTSLDDPGLFETAVEEIVAMDESGFGLVDLIDWLETSPSLRLADRALLSALAYGHDADTLSLMYGVPVKRMRERISRARSRAWAIYQTEVVAA